jgi:N-acyl-D-amino-acid deacylase
MTRWSLLLALLPIVSAASGQQHYDVIIRNGHIIDGTGSPWYSADVGIRDGRIAAIGRLGDAVGQRTIDAKEMIVAPGFIDMLGQSELTILVNPHVPSKIFQGITTEITGEGESVAPLTDALIKADSMGFQHLHVTPDWRTFDQYFTRLEKQGIGINFASYIGATQTRRLILGDADVAPTPAQLTQMRALVREAMLQGAMGVSSALEYIPAPYASTEELIALAAEAAKFGIRLDFGQCAGRTNRLLLTRIGAAYDEYLLRRKVGIIQSKTQCAAQSVPTKSGFAGTSKVKRVQRRWANPS